MIACIFAFHPDTYAETLYLVPLHLQGRTMYYEGAPTSATKLQMYLTTVPFSVSLSSSLFGLSSCQILAWGGSRSDLTYNLD
jgi:hypothetical protein